MQPLAHRRILVTRTRRQASELASQLEALGAIPVLIPTIEIVPPATYAALDEALTRLHTFDWLLFTSANAVDVFHQRLPLPYPPDNPLVPPSEHQESVTTPAHVPSPKIAVIGPATALAVQGIGLTVDLIPSRYVAESLAEALTPHSRTPAGEPANMLLVRAAEARDHLPEALRNAGAHVTIVDAYRNQMPPDSIPALQRLFARPEDYPDAITFTSASTARNLFILLDAANIILPGTITLASIGPITSQALNELGYAPTLEAATPTISSLIESLAAHFNRA